MGQENLELNMHFQAIASKIALHYRISNQTTQLGKSFSTRGNNRKTKISHYISCSFLFQTAHELFRFPH